MPVKKILKRILKKAIKTAIKSKKQKVYGVLKKGASKVGKDAKDAILKNKFTSGAVAAHAGIALASRSKRKQPRKRR